MSAWGTSLLPGTICSCPCEFLRTCFGFVVCSGGLQCSVPSDGFDINLWRMKLLMEGEGGTSVGRKILFPGERARKGVTALCPAVQVCKCLCFLAAKFR